MQYHFCSFRLWQISSGLARSCQLGTSASLHLETRASPLKSIICGRQYLRETFEFPGVTLYLDFIHYTYIFMLLVTLINCSTSGKEDFYLEFSLCAWSNPVDHKSGEIPLEVIHTSLPKRPHIWWRIQSELFSYQSFSPCDTLHTYKERKGRKWKFPTTFRSDNWTVNKKLNVSRN